MKTLVTGATGFLGGAILSEVILLDHFKDYYFLVRAKNATEGLQRLKDLLIKFDHGPQVQSRLSIDQVVLGDFSEPEKIFDNPILKQIRIVINNVAITSFSPIHPGIEKINVVGSLKFVELLAKHSQITRFVHVGTAMCIGPQAPQYTEETYTPPEKIKHLVPYTASKMKFEQLVLSKFPDFPFIRARPSIVVGHSVLGTKPSGSIFWVFRAAHQLGAFVCEVNDLIDVVPVDWVAKALIFLAEKNDLKNTLYQLSAGKSSATRFGELDAPLARGRNVPPLGDSYRHIKIENMGDLRPEFKAKLGRCNAFVMQEALSIYGHFANLKIVFSNTNILDEGFVPPPPFSSYAEICMKTSSNKSVHEEMMSDFK